MWPLVAIALVLVTATGLLPFPVWASRASRALRAPKHKPMAALGPAQAPIHGDLARLSSEVAIAIELSRVASKSIADYAAAALWVRWMDSGSSDNWAKTVVRQALQDEGEAYHAAGRVHDLSQDLPHSVRDNLAPALSKLETDLRSLDGLVAADARPGAHLSGAAVRQRGARLERLCNNLVALHEDIAAPPNDPYRV